MYKEKVEELYQEKINDAIIRSRCDWYEIGRNHLSFSLT